MRLKEFVTEYSQLKKQRAHRDGVDLEVRSNNTNVSIYAYAGGKELAHVHFDRDSNNILPYDLEVGEDYRGQGIASVMYDYAKDLGYTVTRSPEQTDAGKYFWDKNRGEEGQVWENFADGRVKGKSRPGRVKRAGASCNGSVTDLRRKAKNASGERAKMYHWCANMKSGRSKK